MVLKVWCCFSPTGAAPPPLPPLPSRWSKWEDKLRTFILGCNFWWFLDFGPIYKMINKSAQEQSPKKRRLEEIIHRLCRISHLLWAQCDSWTRLWLQTMFCKIMYSVLTGINDWLIHHISDRNTSEHYNTKQTHHSSKPDQQRPQTSGQRKSWKKV